MPSKRFRFNREDLINLAKSAVLVGVTAAALFVAASLDLIDYASLWQWRAPWGAHAHIDVDLLLGGQASKNVVWYENPLK